MEMDVLSKPMRSAADTARRCAAWMVTQAYRLKNSTAGQGTTEYAILVGIIVLIAVIAIGAFREHLANLWSAIEDGINGIEPPKKH